MVWSDVRNRTFVALSDVILEILMKKVRSSKCMYYSIFYRKKPEEWNDIDRKFVKESSRRS
jgi:hypothetical protein